MHEVSTHIIMVQVDKRIALQVRQLRGGKNDERRPSGLP